MKETDRKIVKWKKERGKEIKKRKCDKTFCTQKEIQYSWTIMGVCSFNSECFLQSKDRNTALMLWLSDSLSDRPPLWQRGGEKMKCQHHQDLSSIHHLPDTVIASQPDPQSANKCVKGCFTVIWHDPHIRARGGVAQESVSDFYLLRRNSNADWQGQTWSSLLTSPDGSGELWARPGPHETRDWETNILLSFSVDISGLWSLIWLANPFS